MTTLRHGNTLVRRSTPAQQHLPNLLFAFLLDKVGVMHTGVAGLKHRKLAGKDGLFVDLIHLTALLGSLRYSTQGYTGLGDLLKFQPVSLDPGRPDTSHS